MLYYISRVKKLILFYFIFSVLTVKSQNKTEQYIRKYSSIAVNERDRYNIPASITLAQGILESGNGESRLAVEGNNHFGIKCHNNWSGETIIEDDDEKGECFRKYSDPSDSYRDHSLFLVENQRYAFLFLLNKGNYKSWAKGLKKAGYATNPRYATLLINLIEEYNLDRFDNETPMGEGFYFANSYGIPYLTGLGVYYFNKRSFFFTEVNTSFLFSESIIGYKHKLLKKIYLGVNAGVIYRPTKEQDIIPQIGGGLLYRRNSILIRSGVHIPLHEIEYKMIPFLRVTYLVN